MNLNNNLSIEVCENFTVRLNPNQKREIKFGALIAIRNFIKESKIEDPILYNFLTDTISDPDETVKDFAFKIIGEVSNQEITKILEDKQTEAKGELKKEITNLLKFVKSKAKKAALLNS